MLFCVVFRIPSLILSPYHSRIFGCVSFCFALFCFVYYAKRCRLHLTLSAYVASVERTFRFGPMRTCSTHVYIHYESVYYLFAFFCVLWWWWWCDIYCGFIINSQCKCINFIFVVVVVVVFVVVFSSSLLSSSSPHKVGFVCVSSILIAILNKWATIMTIAPRSILFGVVPSFHCAATIQLLLHVFLFTKHTDTHFHRVRIPICCLSIFRSSFPLSCCWS